MIVDVRRVAGGQHHEVHPPVSGHVAELDHGGAGDGILLQQLHVRAKLQRAQRLLGERRRTGSDRPIVAQSARNRFAGIVTLLDADANILAQQEMIPGSSHLEPVNWRGDGQGTIPKRSRS